MCLSARAVTVTVTAIRELPGFVLKSFLSPSGPFPRVQQDRAVDQQTGLPGKVVGDRVPSSWEGVCLVPHGGRDNSRSTRLLRVSICHLPVQRDTCPLALHMLPGTSPYVPTPACHYLRGTAQLRWSPLQPPEEKLRTQYWVSRNRQTGMRWRERGWRCPQHPQVMPSSKIRKGVEEMRMFIFLK